MCGWVVGVCGWVVGGCGWVVGVCGCGWVVGGCGCGWVAGVCVWLGGRCVAGCRCRTGSDATSCCGDMSCAIIVVTQTALRSAPLTCVTVLSAVSTTPSLSHTASGPSTLPQLSLASLRGRLVDKVDSTSELRRSTAIVYRRDRQALSTARFCRTGQLATADTCLLANLMNTFSVNS